MKKLLPILFGLIIFKLEAQVPSGYSTIYSKNFETSLKAGEYLKKDVWYFYTDGPNVTSYSHPELDKRFIIKNDPKNSSNKTLEMIKFQGDVDYNSSGLNPRTELSFRPSLERSTSKEIYFQLKTYFPANQASVFSAEFIQFWVHGTTGNDTDIPLQIEVRNGNFGARLPRSPGFVTPFSGKSLSANLSRWITWEVKAKFSNNGGYWKIFMDGELVFTYSGPINYWPGNSGTWHPQFGAYANKSGTGTMEIYFDDFIVAEKTNSVVLDCNGTPNGTAKVDACGICSGGTTGISPSSPVNWYADADNDGKGDPAVMIQSCTKPNGYVADKSDLCPDDKNKTSPGNCGCGVAEGSCVNQNPIINFNTPLSSDLLEAPANLYVKVDAADPDGTVAKVLLYLNNEFVRQENLFPYEWGAAGQNDPLLYNLPAGTYVLKAVATDNDGGVSTIEQTIKVSSVVAENAYPSLTITSPSAGSSFNAPATVSIQANASDADGVISKVEFFNGTTLLGADVTSPYSFSMSGLVAGTYSVLIKAIDNAGASTSKSISFVVNPVVVPPSASVGINGPSCVTAGSTVSYTLTTESLNVSAINYWSNSGAVITQNTSDAKKITMQFPDYTNGTTITLTAGVNYTVSPWYKEYTQTINVGGCNARIAAVLSPQPTETNSTLVLEDNQKIVSVVIYNSLGEVVYEAKSLNDYSVVLGDTLAVGLYVVQIVSEAGTTSVRMIKR